MPARLRRQPGREAGMTLVEVLIALVITVIGLLGLVAMQMRSYSLEAESYQRSQALVLLKDMATRIRANPAEYPSSFGDLKGIGAGDPADCGTPDTTSTYDLCQWANLIRGTAEQSGDAYVGAMVKARGCIDNVSETDPITGHMVPVFIVAVAWQGTVPTGDAPAPCGNDQGYPAKTRRVVSMVVRLGDLTS